MTFKSYLDYLS